jgi:hypothetical protein
MEFEIAVSLLVGLFIGIAVGNCWQGLMRKEPLAPPSPPRV